MLQNLPHSIQAKDGAILAFAKKLKEAERVLDILVDDYDEYRRPKRLKSTDDTDNSSNTIVASKLKLSDILSYSHKISYTTFAPPGATHVGALPPAPQEEQMRASQLFAFADLDVGLPKTVDNKEKNIEPLIEVAIGAIKGHLPLDITVPAGWKPGMPVELLTNLPLPPPGWKPGDPVPLPPLESMPNTGRVVERQPRPTMAEPIQVPHVQLDILDEDDDSSDYSSDDED